MLKNHSWICLAAWLAAASVQADGPVTAVLGAQKLEVQMLAEQLRDKQSQAIFGLTFHTGTLGGRKVVVAHSGVGKVNAAMTATVLLDHFRPREVLFTGAAGGLNPELAPGDIVLGAKTVQHDYGNLSPHGFQPEVTRNPVAGDYNPLFFTAAESLLAVAETAGKDVALAKVPSRQGDRLPKIMTGVVATGDVFVSAPAKSAQLREQFQADAVEMEGAAVAQICWQQNMPCLVIRCVSDKADAAAAADFARFREVAAANSAKLTVRTLELLAQKPK